MLQIKFKYNSKILGTLKSRVETCRTDRLKHKSKSLLDASTGSAGDAYLTDEGICNFPDIRQTFFLDPCIFLYHMIKVLQKKNEAIEK